jgi:1,4-dihydroxy-2-naphthoyl-CoA hydrolase
MEDFVAIWFKDYQLSDLQHRASISMPKHLGINMIEIGEDFLRAEMPVDERTKTPMGILHGGASCVLAETLGSFASYLCIDPDQKMVVGVEINANHIKSMTQGYVIGTARPIRVGNRIHVWDIRLESKETQDLICVSRLTVAILEKRAL